MYEYVNDIILIICNCMIFLKYYVSKKEGNNKKEERINLVLTGHFLKKGCSI